MTDNFISLDAFLDRKSFPVFTSILISVYKMFHTRYFESQINNYAKNAQKTNQKVVFLLPLKLIQNP